MPKKMFNIKELYLFKPGGDCAKLDGAIRVHWKREFNNTRSGEGKFTATRMNDGGNDSFTGKQAGINDSTKMDNICVGNIQNGTVMISTGYEDYVHMRFVYTGIPSGDIREEPVIPRFFRNVIPDWVSHKFFRSLLSDTREGRKYKTSYEAADLALYGDSRRDGTYEKARQRVLRMDSWEKKSLSEYLGKINSY